MCYNKNTMVFPSKQIYKRNKLDAYAYLAGLIDGDGSVYITRSIRKGNLKDQFRLNVKVVTTDYNTVLFIKERFGGNVSKESILYSIRWGENNAKRTLNKISKFLILKQEQARLALSISQTSSSKTESYYLKMKELNHAVERVVENPKMKKRLFWAYLAGLIDSDGSITLKRNGKYYHLHLKITSKHINFLKVLKSRIGGGCISESNNKSYTWFDIKWDGISAKHILDKIIPFLIFRQERATLGLKFQLTISKKKNKSEELLELRKRYISEMKCLNSYKLGSCND